MAIKKKDGSTYKLVGPNPMLIGQERWDNDSVFRTHNLDNHKTEIYSLEEKQEPIKTAIEVPTPPVDKSLQVKLYVLPSKREEIYDDLYREKRIHLTYKTPLKMVAQLMRNDHVYFTVLSEKSFDKGSILFYPEDKRWWKVQQITQQSNGFILDCVISEIEPDFSALR